jgi:hypothetical protein
MADQRRITHRAQTGIMRKQRGAHHIVVPMHRIDADHQRDRRMTGPLFLCDGVKGARGGRPWRGGRTIGRADRRRAAPARIEPSG